MLVARLGQVSRPASWRLSHNLRMMSTGTTSSGIAYMRTPESAFNVVKGFDYEPKYKDLDGLRMAYYDEGKGESGHTVLLMHGEPTWSYLYKDMIPPLLEAGHRVVAPDLIGFGRSDKPLERKAYTYEAHVNWTRMFLDQMKLSNVTVFCQDWGGLITLRIAGEEADRYERIVASNTALPIGKSAGPGFDAWREASQKMPVMNCGKIIKNAAVNRKLEDSDVDAFNAPYPDMNESYLAGAREFPMIVPTTPEHKSVTENIAAWKGLAARQKPLLSLWGTADPVLGPAESLLKNKVPGAQGQPHQTFPNGGHFMQLEHGPELAKAMNDWLK
ncbi:hypothetical protein, variant [Sphaeroforma arctica JP610]|uniref:AB hydrolase-1 domain-containing protein n=1 Tax=Sphaeroforma arctica JP610 TaxID=667725 RepID=A0A0L0GBV1_9EUKA|nr:hypothetical protein, variant [Sphaeroforma arctica JP610]KNC86371.1 hypothetical protein, variant [Sphaeroforma arctica JP610]|eukprot:XP_014160274.1 hypothetical protein, variant [Sphaeroforma arctica JP610]